MKFEAILLSLGIVSYPIAAKASIVQRWTVEQASQGTPTINVCPGKGFNILLNKMPGGVGYAKIDDPSQVHISFETRDLGKSPAQLIHLQRIEQLNFRGIPKAPETLLTVYTTSGHALFFNVAYNCPSLTRVAYIEAEAVAQRGFRSNRIQPKDPVIAAPKARVVEKKEQLDDPLLSYSDQFILKGDVNNLYGLNPSQREVPPSPVEQTFAEKDEQENLRFNPPPNQQFEAPKPIEIPVSAPAPAKAPIKTAKAPVELSKSKIAWHLTKGLQQANLNGHINYGTGTYRRWQNVIARVRRGEKLPRAIAIERVQTKVGANLLKMGGLQ